MLDLAFFLHFLDETPHIKFIKGTRPRFAQIMQQIIVKVAGTSPLQGFCKLLDRIFLCLAADPRRILGGQLIALARIPVHQCLADCFFRSGIDECGIKIGEPCFHKQVHHFFHLLHVDDAILLRQTHQPKAQFLNIILKKTHIALLFFGTAENKKVSSMMSKT